MHLFQWHEGSILLYNYPPTRDIIKITWNNQFRPMNRVFFFRVI